MDNSVCKFIPAKRIADVINTINFVLEKNAQSLKKTDIRRYIL